MASYKLDYSHLVNTIDNVAKVAAPSHKVADYILLFVSGISPKDAAPQCELNIDTVKGWKYKSWFSEVCAVARAVSAQKSDRKLSEVLELALVNLKERLLIGDPYTTRDGVSFKPVGAKDSALIAAICYDKRALIRGEPINISESTTFEERLEGLHEIFKSVSAGKKVEIK